MRRFAAVAILALMFSSPAMAEEDAPMTVEGAVTVNAAEAKALFDEGVAFLDVREQSAYDLGRVPSAIHLDVKTDAFTEQALKDKLKPDEKMVVYCNGVKCLRSAAAIKQASAWGFKNFYYYREGFPSWKAANYPVE